MAGLSDPSTDKPSYMDIPSHPDCPIAYNFETLNPNSSTSTQPPILIVFINGLMMPMAGWGSSIALLKPKQSNYPPGNPLPQISLLTYDRYAQGQSQAPAPIQKHNLVESAQELDSILRVIFTTHYTSPSTNPTLIFISHSIGVPLARIYNQLSTAVTQPAAHLFLDSNIANTDFSDIYPDPDAAGFNPADLPADTTVEALRAQRAKTRSMFHPSVPNAEGLDRSTVPELLPKADEPQLLGPREGLQPYVTVVGHDPEAFAEEGWKMTGSPRGLNLCFMSPYWARYNRGLTALTSPERRREGGVVIAKGAGHFVQRDNPDCVASEAWDLVLKLVEDGRR